MVRCNMCCADSTPDYDSEDSAYDGRMCGICAAEKKRRQSENMTIRQILRCLRDEKSGYLRALKKLLRKYLRGISCIFSRPRRLKTHLRQCPV